MDPTLYPATEKDFMQPLKRYSPETSDISNDLAWNQAFC